MGNPSRSASIDFKVIGRSEELRQIAEAIKVARQSLIEAQEAATGQGAASLEAAQKVKVLKDEIEDLGKMQQVAATEATRLREDQQRLIQITGQLQVVTSQAVDAMAQQGLISKELALSLRGAINVAGDMSKANSALAQSNISTSTSVSALSKNSAAMMPVLTALWASFNVGYKVGEGLRAMFPQMAESIDAKLTPAFQRLTDAIFAADAAETQFAQNKVLRAYMREHGVSMEAAAEAIRNGSASISNDLQVIENKMKNMEAVGLQFAKSFEAEAQQMVAGVDAATGVLGTEADVIAQIGDKFTSLASKIAAANGPVGAHGQALLDLAQKHGLLADAAQQSAAASGSAAGGTAEAIGAQSAAMGEATNSALALADAQQVVAEKTREAGQAAVQQAAMVKGAFEQMDADIAAFMASTRFYNAQGQRFGPGQGFQRQQGAPPPFGESAPS